VVWNIFIFPYIGNNDPNWLIFFQRGSNHQPDSVFCGRPKVDHELSELQDYPQVCCSVSLRLAKLEMILYCWIPTRSINDVWILVIIGCTRFTARIVSKYVIICWLNPIWGCLKIWCPKKSMVHHVSHSMAIYGHTGIYPIFRHTYPLVIECSYGKSQCFRTVYINHNVHHL